MAPSLPHQALNTPHGYDKKTPFWGSDPQFLKVSDFEPRVRANFPFLKGPLFDVFAFPPAKQIWIVGRGREVAKRSGSGPRPRGELAISGNGLLCYSSTGHPGSALD